MMYYPKIMYALSSVIRHSTMKEISSYQGDWFFTQRINPSIRSISKDHTAINYCSMYVYSSTIGEHCDAIRYYSYRRISMRDHAEHKVETYEYDS